MASETVKAVLLAESNADKSVSEAHKTADEIIAAARKYSDDELRKQLSAAEFDAEKLRSDNQKRIEDFRRKTNEKSKQQTIKTKKLADENMLVAAGIIINHLVCQ